MVEALQIEIFAANDALLQERIARIRFEDELEVMANAVAPPAPVKAGIFPFSALPVIGPNTTREDFAAALELVEVPNEAELAHTEVIEKGKLANTYFAYLRVGAPEEVHTKYAEHFLCLEGACDVHMEGKVIHIKKDDVFMVQPHVPHSVVVTSPVPCQFVYQRVWV